MCSVFFPSVVHAKTIVVNQSVFLKKDSNTCWELKILQPFENLQIQLKMMFYHWCFCVTFISTLLHKGHMSVDLSVYHTLTIMCPSVCPSINLLIGLFDMYSWEHFPFQGMWHLSSLKTIRRADGFFLSVCLSVLWYVCPHLLHDCWHNKMTDFSICPY